MSSHTTLSLSHSQTHKHSPTATSMEDIKWRQCRHFARHLRQLTRSTRRRLLPLSFTLQHEEISHTHQHTHRKRETNNWMRDRHTLSANIETYVLRFYVKYLVRLRLACCVIFRQWHIEHLSICYPLPPAAITPLSTS